MAEGVISQNLTTAAELSLRFWQAVAFVIPVTLAGLIHIAVIKLDLFAALGRCPLDQHLTLRGRRLLGQNKTLRGALIMTGATSLMTGLLAQTAAPLYQRLAICPFQVSHPWLWGLLVGAGYWLGELPNSFVKRQLDIAPGAMAAGTTGIVFWLVDQLDSVAGVFLLLSIVWRPDALLIVIVAAMALLLHPLVAALMVALRLKVRVG